MECEKLTWRAHGVMLLKAKRGLSQAGRQQCRPPTYRLEAPSNHADAPRAFA